MNTTTTSQNLKEYASVPIAELVESSTNPRRAFDVEQLEELAGSVRSKGIVSPLVVRQVNGHFEIIAGARRYRAAHRRVVQIAENFHAIAITFLAAHKAVSARRNKFLLRKRRHRLSCGRTTAECHATCNFAQSQQTASSYCSVPFWKEWFLKNAARRADYKARSRELD